MNMMSLHMPNAKHQPNQVKAKSYLITLLSAITKLTDESGAQYALLLVVSIIISTFLLKNIFDILVINQ